VILTALAGGLDAAAFLNMGGTFVSAQTGTILLLSMNASGTHAVEADAAVASLLAFIAGTAIAARIMPSNRRQQAWARETLAVVVLEVVLILVGTLVAWQSDVRGAALVAPVALAMGLQATLARRFGLAYLTSGYLTGSTTKAVMGSPFGDDSNPSWWYVAIPLGALVVGAVTLGSIASSHLTVGPLVAAVTAALAALFAPRARSGSPSPGLTTAGGE
jgi:uncharacterized membrane protein YoaK (UPF0700 family)